MEIKTKTQLKSLQSLDPRITPEARAERLRRLRNLANLSRRDVCVDSGLNINTYKGWEIGRYGGLTRTGAERALERFEKEGVISSLDWLYYGIGSGPQVRPDHVSILNDLEETKIPMGLASKFRSEKDEEQQIVKELIVFRQQSRHCVDLVVSDDGMCPYYVPGDYVAGVRRYNSDMDRLLNFDCIVQTKEGFTLLRKLRSDSKPGCYTLVCSNLETDMSQPVLYHVELISAAPVIWHRRRGSMFSPDETK